MGKFKRRLSLNHHPTISYYSLTNIDDKPTKKFKKTSDIGYASEDDLEKTLLKRSSSDGHLHMKMSSHLSSNLSHSLPCMDYSIPSIYETCLNETKKISLEPSLSIYRKKYLTSPPLTSHSYDGSVESTDDGDQSDNDVDIFTSIPIHHYGKGESLYYNRYATTTTTGYSSDDHPLMSSIHSEPCWDGYQVNLLHSFLSLNISSRIHCTVQRLIRWNIH